MGVVNTSISTSRIEARFRELEERRAKGLVAYLTAGDPTLEATGGLVAAVDRGAGATLRKILERLPGWREAARAPVILFTYYNPVLQYGLENFARAAAEAGADGALVVDLTPEEAEAYVSAMRARKLDTAFLASPTSTDERLERVAKLSSGFLYLISRTGVTGERSEISSTLRPLVERSRRFTSLPLAVGFGLSTPAQVREVQILADAAVVGSALVRAIEEHCHADGGARAQGFGPIEQFVRWLKHGTGTEPQ
ncbi:MAG: tryptophan synthase subunit alpha [Acidobacteria bacterium]|nr:MAG: tryptophan synthase subunit alpha [Acidobacteriota bacterium]